MDEQPKMRTAAGAEAPGERSRARAEWPAAKWWPVGLIIVLCVALGPRLIGPACPSQVRMVTGAPDGAYYRYAQQYRKILARDGIDLVVVPTSGAKENLARLTDASQGVSLAMFQGGAAEAVAGIDSLAAVYLEPVWVFARADRSLKQLTDLAGLRVAVGPNGSGTQALATKLLSANGLRSPEFMRHWVALPNSQAAQALARGEIDAAMLVAGLHSPLIKELLADPHVQLMDFSRGAAYESRFRFLSQVTLPQGAVDLAANLPHESKRLLAPSASVVARSDLHPAIVPLMMKAMIETHGQGETLSKPGEFPSAHHVTFPMRAMSRHYLKFGPSFLYRLLPFWVAAWVDRTKLLVLPMLTLLLPALRLAPPVYIWRVRRRIYRWYGVLRNVDEQLRSGAAMNTRAAHRQLDIVDQAIANVAVPMGYMEELFNLRLALDDVRRRMESAEQDRPAVARRVA